MVPVQISMISADYLLLFDFGIPSCVLMYIVRIMVHIIILCYGQFPSHTLADLWHGHHYCTLSLVISTVMRLCNADSAVQQVPYSCESPSPDSFFAPPSAIPFTSQPCQQTSQYCDTRANSLFSSSNSCLSELLHMTNRVHGAHVGAADEAYTRGIHVHLADTDISWQSDKPGRPGCHVYRNHFAHATNLHAILLISWRANT